MSQTDWTKQGETLSLKNACKEFGLEESEIKEAINIEKLQYKVNYAHGNPYFKLLRKEVMALVLELHGEDFVEIQKIDFKIRTATKGINSFKRKLSALEKEKVLLMQQKTSLLQFVILDRNRNEVNIGSRVQVLFIEPGFISTFPYKEAKIMKSMINKNFEVVGIEHGKALVHQPFDPLNGFTLALASEEMELVDKVEV